MRGHCSYLALHLCCILVSRTLSTRARNVVVVKIPILSTILVIFKTLTRHSKLFPLQMVSEGCSQCLCISDGSLLPVMATKAGFEKVGFRLKCVNYKQSLFCSRIRGEERKIFEARAAKPQVAWAPEGERKGSLSFRAPSGDMSRNAGNGENGKFDDISPKVEIQLNELKRRVPTEQRIRRIWRDWQI